MEELIKYMRALLMLELQTARAAAAAHGASFRPEVLLADAGFGHREIAVLVGKSPVAVAKAISRGRAARKESGDAQQTNREEDTTGE